MTAKRGGGEDSKQWSEQSARTGRNWELERNADEDGGEGKARKC